MNNLVSIIIPTFKRYDLLPRAMESVLMQSYKYKEIIVVDDNAPNSKERQLTEKLMKNYTSKGVLYIKHEQNKNGSAARNTGIKNSTGEYIMFLDDDDEFLPGKIQNQLNRLRNLDNTWGACYSGYLCYSGQSLVYTSKERKEGTLLKDALMRNLWIAGGSNLMIRRSVIDKIGLFNETFSRNQDIEFLVRILKQFKIAKDDHLGLKIYIYNKQHAFTLDELTDQYLSSFSKTINNLPLKDRADIYKMLNLQIVRDEFFVQKNYKKAFMLIHTRQIDAKNCLCYFLHLLYRKIFKIGCGYELKH